MNSSPFKTYGFVYIYNDREFAQHIVASSEAEAKERMQAMATAEFVGEMKRVDPAEFNTTTE